ncbi:MAG: hypothetical protein JWN78_3064 [Bacteroidota bacterium]|nr:hypothetical protein [Bacteroidota bacterium]
MASDNSSALYSNAPAGTYYIVVDGYDGASGNYTLTVDCISSCILPDIQANNISFDIVGTNSMSIGWNNGNGEGRILVGKENSSVTDYRINGVSYFGSSSFGSGSTIGSGELCDL